jgi:peptide/nickel transport system substrate-binding protein
MYTRLATSCSFLLLAASAIACGSGDRTGDDGPDRGGEPGGTLVVAVTGDADHLTPMFYESITGRQVIDQIYDHLADIGDELNTIGDAGFEPALAERWEWADDSLSIAFHLNPRARWHDGRPVRASDVRFTHSLYVDPAVASQFAPLLENIDSVQVRDSLTAVVWYAQRSPQQFFDATYQMHIVPEHALAGADRRNLRAAPFDRAPIGSGRFRFVRWTPGQSLEIIADTANYRGRAMLDRVIWSVSPDPAASITKLSTGAADWVEVLRPEDQRELSGRPDIELVPYPTMQYAAMFFNLNSPQALTRPHPLFGDRELRRALTMAVDRRAMVRNVFDTLGLVGIGPITRSLATADTSIAQLPFERSRAAAILDSLGWRDADGDGVRERNGRALEFTLLTPSSSAFRMRMAVLLQEQLAQVGARVNVEPMEFGTFLQRQNTRRFDAVLAGVGSDPLPSGIRQMWSAGSIGGGGGNVTGYSSPTFDALVDSGAQSMDPQAGRRHFRRAYETIVADAPAIWLYEARFVAGSHARIERHGLRADGWWANLADWTIPPGERIARDRIGLRAAAADEATAPAAGAPADTTRR